MSSCEPPTTEQIDNYILKKLENKPQVSEGKNALIMVGGPGSGKSSTKIKALEHLGLNTQTFVDIDPDEAMTSLLNNNNKCRWKANSITGKLFKEASNNGYNIIYDGTGKTFKNYFSSKIKYLKKRGYNVTLCINILDVDEAIVRISRRAKMTGRDVAEEDTMKMYMQLEESIPKYLGVSCVDVDKILVYNTMLSPPLVYEMSCESHGRVARCFIKDNALFNELCPSCCENSKKRKRIGGKKHIKTRRRMSDKRRVKTRRRHIK